MTIGDLKEVIDKKTIVRIVDVNHRIIKPEIYTGLFCQVPIEITECEVKHIWASYTNNGLLMISVERKGSV